MQLSRRSHVTNNMKRTPYTQETDILFARLAQKVSKTRAATWERAVWLPIILLALTVICAQEGMAEMAALPSNARDAVQRYGLPADLVALAALGYLFWLGWRTYVRTMWRAEYTGLQNA